MIPILSKHSAIVLLCCLAIVPFRQPQAATLTEAEALEIGVEAYHYLYPLMTMDLTRQLHTSLPAGSKPGFGPVNTFHHVRTYMDVGERSVVRPNFDTLYSISWLDLTSQPVFIETPEIKDRYFVLPFYDMWTNVYATVGTQTTGTAAGRWMVVGPDWQGKVPEGVQLIRSPTSYSWIIGRIQTNGPADYQAVRQLQDQLKMHSDSSSAAEAAPDELLLSTGSKRQNANKEPLFVLNQMDASQYFSKAAELIATYPAQKTDWAIQQRMARIGLVAGKPFELQNAAPEVKQALTKVPALAVQQLKKALPRMGQVSNGWMTSLSSMGVYGNDYHKRALVTLVGLGALPPHESVYPVNVSDQHGQPLDGRQSYQLHFSKEQLPPVEAFWSVTMYDEAGFAVDNPLNRYALGDRDPLKYNADGSLTILIQHQAPADEQLPNWLPAPAQGKMGMTMRLYAPRPHVLNGQWLPPAVQRLD